MEQTQTAEAVLYDCTGMLGENHPTVIEAMESYAQQIREEEQDKTREVAIEFAEHCREVPYSNFTDDILAEIRKETEKEFDDFKKQGEPEQQKCVECGRPMQKKEIIIKGDEDTCDECLCPE